MVEKPIELSPHKSDHSQRSEYEDEVDSYHTESNDTDNQTEEEYGSEQEEESPKKKEP